MASQNLLPDDPESLSCSSLRSMSLSDRDDQESTTASTDSVSGEYSPTEEVGIPKNMIDYKKDVLSSYKDLTSRRVDLVGDYAGNELFLIEGDSLLLRSFSDEQLDFENGFQLLHAVYIVEDFLSQLQRRKCRFKIVFFDSNRQLCMPSTASLQAESKFLLAREIIIRHLRFHLSRMQNSLEVSVFPDYESTDFLQYLQKESPYFLMLHDGAQDGSTSYTEQEQNKRAGYREMILVFMQKGLNTALVNELECRDSKVITVVLESNTRDDSFKRSKSLGMSTEVKENDGLNMLEISYAAKEDMSSLTEKQLLLVFATARLLSSPTDTVKSELDDMCSQMLLHQAHIMHAPLSRRITANVSADPAVRRFLGQFALTAMRTLVNDSWSKLRATSSVVCDIADFMDGQAFYQACNEGISINPEVLSTYSKLKEAVVLVVGKEGSKQPHLTTFQVDVNPLQVETSQKAVSHDSKVLPFRNAVFDSYLAPIKLQIEVNEEQGSSFASQKIFREISHWRNQNRPLEQKGVPAAKDSWQASRAARRNQLFMAEMRTYAASLTNSVGKSLEPETVVVGTPDNNFSTKALTDVTSHTKSHGSVPEKSKPKGGAKAAKMNASKQEASAKRAAEKTKKLDTANERIIKAWREVSSGFKDAKDPYERYRKAETYLLQLSSSLRSIVGPECELYMLSCLFEAWSQLLEKGQQHCNLHIVGLMWHHACSIFQVGKLPASIIKGVQTVAEALSIPFPTPPDPIDDRRQKSLFGLDTSGAITSINVSPTAFQLLYCGPYLERSFDAKEDARVPFKPDEWQGRVLDSIDADKSVFVVAPTSAGKTFISFYAMRKVLKADDDGILVYVAPTKALVNQIAAEIQARYSKSFRHGGKSVWAIHTRDYRINSPLGCQILVTVPHILQIMLLSPSNAKSWSNRVRRIILDEVHSIGNADDGVVWEQLLMMAPCPIIALSATVGNPGDFSQWLSSTQEAMGNELVTVQHPHRYSDLRKYVYVSPKVFNFTGVPHKHQLTGLGLDGVSDFHFLHPVITIDKTRGIPEDLTLEPRDCYQLWEAMQKVQTAAYPVPSHLAPQTSLPEIVRKVDVLVWEKQLKNLLQKWLHDPVSPLDELLRELGKNFHAREQEPLYQTCPGSKSKDLHLQIDDVASTTLALLCRLQQQDALPAILFNYDRGQCENICRTVCHQLEAAEKGQIKSGAKWEKKLERWEEWKTQVEKDASKLAKDQNRKSKKGKGKDGDDEKTSKLELQKSSGLVTPESNWATFDPNAPEEGYHFADYTKAQGSELAGYTEQLQKRGVSSWLISALARGIGVHHAGMNRKYRQVVEILFRKRFLRVVIATGTLALGINMPCKTTVFVADSVYLTALNYRQCAGRAGRRGFDLLGNVVFHGIPEQKVFRLLSSRLPDLNGHFPVTTTLVLRLFLLLHESGNSKYAVNSISALLSQPRLHLGGDSFRDQTLHHLRFSIEYLRRQSLLGVDGTPLNFAGLVTHLYYTENSSFAFHALLKEGYFHTLCADIESKEEQTLPTLMLVMAHLFGRVQCRRVDLEYKETIVKPSSSIVFLPDLPAEAARILKDHNEQTLQVYKTYVKTFIDQHVKHDDNKLPLTGMICGAPDSREDREIDDSSSSIRSSFVALSGGGDDFKSIHDLCSTVRSGVFLEEAVIPYMQISPDNTKIPLNAWLLDFFKHGDVKTLERANGIRRSDIWFQLNDFSLVLASMVTSLTNFLKLTTGNNMDMLDIQGGLDELEYAKEVALATAMESDVTAPKTGQAAMSSQMLEKISSRRKAKVADSWDDEDEESDNGDIEADEAEEELNTNASDHMMDHGLLNVLRAFTKLRIEFNEKFRAMWA